MSRLERWGTRPSNYSSWHRGLPDDDLTMIDIDACEYCQKCYAPLCLIEEATDVGQSFKNASVTRSLAIKASIPCYLVLTTVNAGSVVQFRVTQIAPHRDRERIYRPNDFADVLRALRIGHQCARVRTAV